MREGLVGMRMLQGDLESSPKHPVTLILIPAQVSIDRGRREGDFHPAQHLPFCADLAFPPESAGIHPHPFSYITEVGFYRDGQPARHLECGLGAE